jgi:ribose 5-phosphate isomerase A
MQDSLKVAAAKAAISYVAQGSVVGVGTGSTVNFFIKELAKIKHDIDGAVASSKATKQLLLDFGIPVLDANVIADIPVYIDGADEVIRSGYCLKGGGGALAQEKIIAAIADKFICIVDEAKMVSVLGNEGAVAIEVLPVARSYVGRKVVALGATPVYREGFITDNGNIILDVYGLDLTDIHMIDTKLNNITGVVCHGIFVAEKPHTILVAASSGVEVINCS